MISSSEFGIETDMDQDGSGNAKWVREELIYLGNFITRFLFLLPDFYSFFFFVWHAFLDLGV